MKRNCLITPLIYLILLGSFVSCVERFRNEKNNIEVIKKHLKIDLPTGVSSFNSAYECLDNSFKKPCVFFCSFSISKSNFANWTKEIKIPVLDDSLLINIWNKDEQVRNKITNIKLRDFAKTNSYKWWTPSACNYRTLYASLYNSESKEIIRSFKDSWDGRVLIIYCDDNSICYFIVETFL